MEIQTPVYTMNICVLIEVIERLMIILLSVEEEAYDCYYLIRPLWDIGEIRRVF